MRLGIYDRSSMRRRRRGPLRAAPSRPTAGALHRHRRSETLSGHLAANALTGLRLALTVPFIAACAIVPGAAAPARLLPLLLFCVVAASDIADGRIARYWGTASARGHVFDNIADMTFVGCAFLFFATRGSISWFVPVAMAGAVGAYAVDSARHAWGTGRVHLARSPIGHVAGIANYALVGILATDIAVAGAIGDSFLRAACITTAAINTLSVVSRLRPHLRPRPGRVLHPDRRPPA